MELRLTTLGLLIYAALGMFLAAGAVLAGGRRRAGLAVYACGFAAAAAAYAVRWIEAEHVPLQSMFEVFLCMAMLMFPISVGCRRWLGVGDEWADALLAAVLLAPAGFIFKADILRLPPALQSIIFFPHVSSYMLSYVIMAKATVPAARCVLGLPGPAAAGLVASSAATYRMVSLGFPLLTLGLLLGAVWGKLAWGDYWNWDPKELWSLISWLIYLGYFHFRHMFGPRLARLACFWVILGLVAIVITLLVVTLSRIFGGMHSYAS